MSLSFSAVNRVTSPGKKLFTFRVWLVLPKSWIQVTFAYGAHYITTNKTLSLVISRHALNNTPHARLTHSPTRGLLRTRQEPIARTISTPTCTGAAISLTPEGHEASSPGSLVSIVVLQPILNFSMNPSSSPAASSSPPRLVAVIFGRSERRTGGLVAPCRAPIDPGSDAAPAADAVAIAEDGAAWAVAHDDDDASPAERRDRRSLAGVVMIMGKGRPIAVNARPVATMSSSTTRDKSLARRGLWRWLCSGPPRLALMKQEARKPDGMVRGVFYWCMFYVVHVCITKTVA